MQKIRKKLTSQFWDLVLPTDGRTDERSDERMNGGAEQKSYDTSLSAGLQ